VVLDASRTGGCGEVVSGRSDRLPALRAPAGVQMLTPCEYAPLSQVYQPSMGPSPHTSSLPVCASKMTKAALMLVGGVLNVPRNPA
jgi:hypothetical protein